MIQVQQTNILEKIQNETARSTENINQVREVMKEQTQVLKEISSALNGKPEK
jgi:predicted RNase H-related nuclease YkuK (DUF458 family)